MYEFKRLPELGWAILTAIAVEAGQILINTDFNAVTDWRTWIVSVLFAGLVRAVFAGAMNWRRQKQ